MFVGVYTAIITPFKDGELDRPALRNLVELQVAAGVSGIVACGTTGEASSLTDHEFEGVLSTVVETVAGRAQVLAGVGTLQTKRTVALSKAAHALGIDGALVVTPYYNKPTQEGLYAHFSAVSDAVPELPLMLYNVPNRTGVSLQVDTVARLAEKSTVGALKDAGGHLGYTSRLVADCGDSINVLSGDDVTALPTWAVGGRGVVSVASNVIPARMVELWRRFIMGDLKGAQSLNARLLPLFDGLFLESNPIPVKAMVSSMTGLCANELRLPLTPASPQTLEAFKPICARLEIEKPL